MRIAIPATTNFSITVRVIILMTLLWGCVYALEGVYLILVWANWLDPQPNDLSVHIIDHFDNPIPLLALFGVLFLVFGIMAFLSALGLLWRKPWGRILTLIVAALAIWLGLRSLDVGPPIIEDTTNVSFGITQLAYGILAFAILSRNRFEPVWVYVYGLVNFLVGLPTALFFAKWLIEFGLIEGFRNDTATRFATLASLSGFVAGFLMVALGMCLLFSCWKRFVTVVAMIIAVAGAQSALAVFALLGALLGHSKGGLLEASLLVFVLPFAAVLLVLTACGVWYLKKPQIRSTLRAERQ